MCTYYNDGPAQIPAWTWWAWKNMFGLSDITFAKTGSTELIYFLREISNFVQKDIMQQGLPYWQIIAWAISEICSDHVGLDFQIVAINMLQLDPFTKFLCFLFQESLTVECKKVYVIFYTFYIFYITILTIWYQRWAFWYFSPNFWYLVFLYFSKNLVFWYSVK